MPVSKAFQMGKFPYLKNGSTNMVDSEQACMDQCNSIPECQYGTFVTAAKETPDGTHAYSHAAKYGECWLSATTHEDPVACGVPCKGFQKVKLHDLAPKPDKAPRLDQTNEKCACDVQSMEPEAYMKCMTACIAHGLHTYTKSACRCDPTTTQSKFTTCKQDAFTAHLLVEHLQPRFHTQAMNGGEQHRCMMIKPADGAEEKCACCDCHDTGYYSIREIGFGMHTAKAPFLAGAGPVMADDMHTCQEKCHEIGDTCRAGTFITGGASEGQCYLSEHIEKAKACSEEKPCASFVHVTHEAIDYEAANPELKGPDHITRGIDQREYADFVNDHHNKYNNDPDGTGHRVSRDNGIAFRHSDYAAEMELEMKYYRDHLDDWDKQRESLHDRRESGDISEEELQTAMSDLDDNMRKGWDEFIDSLRQHHID